MTEEGPLKSTNLENALTLHAEAPAVDLHADSLLWSRLVGYDITKRHRPPLPLSAFGGHVDVPRLKSGGIGAQFFGLVSLPGVDLHPAETCRRQIALLREAINKGRGKLQLSQTLDTPARADATQALLGIEGAHALEGRVDEVERFARLGVRYLGLLHLTRNACGSPSFGLGANRHHPLTAFGRGVIQACESAGVLVDLSHINRRGFFNACETATKPLIVSHTGLAGVHPSRRNIDDAQLRAVAELGGVAGVIFCPFYLGRDGLDAVVDHLLHIINVAGEDVPALGSDWDGFIRPTRGLEDPTKLPHLTQRLLSRGVAERVVKKILRLNVLRLMAEVPVRHALTSSAACAG